MPVYDYTYQTFKGARRGPLFRWLTLPKFTLLDFFSKRMFIWLFTVAWLQFLLRLGYMYLLVNVEFLKALNIPTDHLPRIGPYFFKNVIDVQLLFCFLFAFLLGGGLISRDLRHNAIVLYLSKPISLWEYFLGKLMTLFPFMMVLTWLQATLLFLIQTLIAPEYSDWHVYFWRDYAWVLGAITLYSVVVSLALSLLILAASSLTVNARYAGITFAVFIIGSSIVASIVFGIVHAGLFLSPFFSGIKLGYSLFHISDGPPVSTAAAWLGVIGACLVSAMILRWRLCRAALYSA